MKYQYVKGVWYDKSRQPVEFGQHSDWEKSTLPDIPSVSHEKMALWLHRLKELSGQTASLDSKIYDYIQEILYYFQKKEIVLAFGGHFKSGKSTIINAALGRMLLPVDDLPETGVACFLRSGKEDTVEVHLQQGQDRQDRFSIGCNTATIREMVSLISKDGERRKEVQQIDRLEITLKDSKIPERAIWIDSPGINDTIEMTGCARRAAYVSDMLVWVLSSRQCLSVPEVEFLADYITKRSSLSVIFLLNVFLKEDTQEEWEKFQNKNLEVLHNKVDDWAHVNGSTDTTPPELIAVSGRALCESNHNGFGSGDLRGFLNALDSSEHPRIQRARLHRAMIDLRELAQEIRERVQGEQIGVDRERSILEKRQQDAMAAKRDFISAVKYTVAECLLDWRARALQCGKETADSITNPVLRDDTYTKRLTAKLKTSANEVANILINTIAHEASRFNQKPVDSQQAYELWLRMTPTEAKVVVANDKARGLGIEGGAMGGVIAGSAFPVIGQIAGGIIGGIVGVIHSAIKESNQCNINLSQTKQNAITAAETAANALQQKREDIINFIIKCCTVEDNSLPQSEPDTTHLKQWREADTSITQLIEEAKTMAQTGLSQ